MKIELNLSTICLSMGLALTSASQLRFGSLPIGVGEVMLCIWILFTVLHLLKNEKLLINSLAKQYIMFWFGMFLFLVIGAMIGLYLDSWSVSFYHDTLSFLFIALLFLVCLLKPNFKRQIYTVLALTLTFIILPLLLLRIYGHFSPTIGQVQLWFDEVRFLGWAVNPNQIAFTVCGLPFLAIYLFMKQEHIIAKIWYFMLTVASIWIGLSSGSDTLQAAWSVGGLLFIILLWFRAFTVMKTKYWQGVFAKIILPIFTLSVLFIFGEPIQTEMKENVSSILGDGDQGEYRYKLWARGLEATAQSPLFGHGPGPHSGINEPFEEYESHNTFVDISTINGIFGLLIYLVFIIWVTFKAWVTKQNTLLIGLVTILMFSTFHLILRYPIFWFYLVTILTICQPTTGAKTNDASRE